MEFTHKPVIETQIVVDRGYGPCEVTMTHSLHLPLIDQRTLETVGSGAMIGIGVRDERGFNLYCQPGQVIA